MIQDTVSRMESIKMESRSREREMRSIKTGSSQNPSKANLGSDEVQKSSIERV